MAVSSEQFVSEVTAKVAAKLGEQKYTQNAATVVASESNNLYEAAAVLAWFDSKTLRPAAPIDDSEDSKTLFDELLAECEVIKDKQNQNRWTLSANRRIAVLRQLRERNKVETALNANQRPTDEPVQRALDAGLAGKSINVDSLSMSELAATYQVAGWLRDAGFSELPKQHDILARIDWLTLLQPFEHIAGKNFRGRSEELSQIRSYVADIHRQTLGARGKISLNWIEKSVRSIFSIKSFKPLVIYGPGGIGKSTLVARFLLEHAKASKENRIQFAYLDFDRPEVSGDEPLTLLAETARQISVEYPHARESCAKLREAWLRRIAEFTSEPSCDPAGFERARQGAIKDFVSVVDRLESKDKPLVMVLDTFEEVQYRGEQAVDNMLNMLSALGGLLPQLRVVIAGRSEISGREVEAIELKVFDEESAIAYLEARGLHDSDLARQLYKQFGGSPLTLKLAADIVGREMLKDGKLDIQTREWFFRKLRPEHIQRQLYKRVIEHIHDEKLRKLLHPGLVLRRITPALILEVLAQPCGVKVESLSQAERLFEELKRELSLVRSDPDGALRHRQDLRLLMLDLLQEDKSEQAHEIHKRAVDFYQESRDSPQDRAEEIYHRLWLRQGSETIDPRWRNDVARYLYSALVEFKGHQRAFLASRLNVDIDDETLKEALQPDWELIVSRRAKSLIRTGKIEDALKALSERIERTPESPLFSIEASALACVRGRLKDALSLLGMGVEVALKSGLIKIAIPRALLFAEFSLAAEDPEKAKKAIEYLDTLEHGELEVLDLIECRSKRALLSRVIQIQEPEISVALDDMLSRVSDAQLSERPKVLFWAATVPGGHQAVRLARAFKIAGCPVASAEGLHSLARLIINFDVSCSKRANQAVGFLARLLEVPIKESIAESWSELILKSSKELVGKTLAILIEENIAEVTLEFLKGLEDVVLDAVKLRVDTPSVAKAGPMELPVPPFQSLSDLQLSNLAKTMVSTFDHNEFIEFLQYRLDRSFYSIAPLNIPYPEAIVSVLNTANREGWFPLLLARAREAKPQNVCLAKATAELGRFGLAGNKEITRQLEEANLSAGFVSIEHLIGRLGGIETLVCRVEVGGKPFCTGFLVGVDLVLTAEILMRETLRAVNPLQEVAFRFDFKEDAKGRIITEGVLFRLDREWKVASRPFSAGPNDFGYAIVRLTGSPGAQAVGDSRSESQAQLRRWIEIPDPVLRPEVGDTLFILYSSDEGTLKLSAGSIKKSDDKNIYYDHTTLHRSPGAPCFSARLELVALHLGHAAKQGIGFKVGVRLEAILRDLESQRLDHLLRERFV